MAPSSNQEKPFGVYAVAAPPTKTLQLCPRVNGIILVNTILVNKIQLLAMVEKQTQDEADFASKGTTAQTNQALRRKNVLVVDDEPQKKSGGGCC